MVPIGSYLLSAWSLGSGATWQALEGMTLLEWVGLFGGSVSLRVDFGVSNSQARPSVFLSPAYANLDIELLGTFKAPYLPACCYAPCHDNGLNL